MHFLGVKSGAVDACIIDSTMAAAMTGEGTDYCDLASGLTLIDRRIWYCIQRKVPIW